MLAPPRLAFRGPSATRRRAVGGSLLGLGLLVVTGATAPAALADPESSTDGGPTPDGQDAVTSVRGEVLAAGDDAEEHEAATIEGFFGRGKSIAIQVGYEPGAAPDGLSLAGAEFVFTDSAGQPAGACRTEAAGTCTVHSRTPGVLALLTSRLMDVDEDTESGDSDAPVPGDELDLWWGSYTVVQTAAPDGLVAAQGEATIDVCLPWSCDDVPAAFPEVVDDSLFSTPVCGTVVDAVTGAPISGAPYTLSGPADGIYPPPDGSDGSDAGSTGDDGGSASEIPAEDGPDVTVLSGAESGAALRPAVESVTTTSSPTGELVFAGWFLASDDYLLTPGDAVAGYDPDSAAIEVRLGVPAADRSGLLTPRRLTPVTPLVTATPTTPTAVPVPVTAAPVPVTAAPVLDPAAAAGTRSNSPANRAAAAAPGVPTTAPVTSSAAATPTRSAPTATASAATPAVTPVADGPQLETEGSSIPDPALIGFGLFFLVLVATGLGWIVRRRVRAAD